MAKGSLLENLSWKEAEKVLSPDALVVIPLGAAAKEHGPHLQLNNDFLIAEHLKRFVLEHCDVVIAPTINYHFFPAFVDYPGSTTLTQETARDLVVDIVRSLAKFGPKKFYILNTGISTIRPLKQSAEILEKEGIRFRYSDVEIPLSSLPSDLLRQAGGTHADEVETSMMLVIAPETVNMHLASKDFQPDAKGPLTRDASKPGSYSPSGIWGDATFATREKGEMIMELIKEYLVSDIASMLKDR